MNGGPDIQHIVVLMLENRSFDSMLGQLYPSDATFEGLTGQETNDFGGRPIPVWKSTGTDPTTMSIPDPDPGEMFTDMNVQLFGSATGAGAPNMGGFVENYMTQPKVDKPFDPRSVLHFFTPEQVPVISALAKAFGVCDQWHASAPCQTWPNRFFAHTGTALGNVNNSQFPIPFPAPSLFDRLQSCGRTWRVYYHDVPQSLLLRDVWLHALLHYRFFSQFLVDAHTGALPQYSFIEPRYFTDTFLREVPNDQHPPHNVLYGEQLIAAVYNAVRSSPCWKKTLLIVTCDEHGGCYDHMAPPQAVAPDASRQNGFDFTRYGVRVPAVVVSPYIPAGSKIRSAPNGLPALGPPYPFDHTSIIATARKLFELGGPSSRRDAVAPDLVGALSLRQPCNDGPAVLTAAAPSVSTIDAQRRGTSKPNDMQTRLAQMAASLPAHAPADAVKLPEPEAMLSRTYTDAATARIYAVAKVKSFLNLA